MKRTRQIKCLASLSVVLSIMLSLVQVNAFAVTQFELDEIQKEKNELTAQRGQSRDKRSMRPGDFPSCSKRF